MQSITRPRPTSTSPDDAHHDHGPSETACVDLISFVNRMAGSLDQRFAQARGTVNFDEFQDRGMYGLERALRAWTPTHRLSFSLYAHYLIHKEMLHATERYTWWHYPGRGQNTGRYRPCPDHLRPVTTQETTVAQEQHHWFHAEVARHQACFTVQGRTTLTDVLNELPYAIIAARDGIGVKHARQRYATLVSFLRTHVFGGQTTCHAEQARRTLGGQHQGARALAAVAAEEGGLS